MKDQIIKNRLLQANTLNEIIKIANEYYDLDAELSKMSKTIIVNNLDNLFRIARTKKR